MTHEMINDAPSWRDLLDYYTTCLITENRQRYTIGRDDVARFCRFLPGLDPELLTAHSDMMRVDASDPAVLADLSRFVLGQPNRTPPTVGFGYPFLVTADRGIVPLLYVEVSGQKGAEELWVKAESEELEINFAALFAVLAGDREISVEALFSVFDNLMLEEGESRFVKTLRLLLENINDLAGAPMREIRQPYFRPERRQPHSVVYCPMLFHVTASGYTRQLLRELEQLKRRPWTQAGDSLRWLLAPDEGGYSYPGVPEPAQDPRFYILPANDKQRQAVIASETSPVTVVTGPPGTGKSQLILSIAGNAVLRGETVLIASRNNNAVDVVYDRFFQRVSYPGAVRSGKRALRHEMAQSMRQAFSGVRQGSVPARLEEVRERHAQLNADILRQDSMIAEMEQRLHDHRLLSDESANALSALPTALQSFALDRPCDLKDAARQALGMSLLAAIRDVADIHDRVTGLERDVCDALAANSRGLVALDALAGLADRYGASDYRSLVVDKRPVELQAISVHLESWHRIFAAIHHHRLLRDLRDQVADRNGTISAQLSLLPSGLRASVGEAALQYDSDQAPGLRRELDGLLLTADSLSSRYAELWSNLTPEAPFVRSWLEATPGIGSVTLENQVDLNCLCETLARSDEVVDAQHLGAELAEQYRQIAQIKAEREATLSRFRERTSPLEVALAEAKQRIPVLSLGQLSKIYREASAERWQELAIAIQTIEEWGHRVHEGKLNLLERLYMLLVRDWSIQELETRVDKLVKAQPPAMHLSFATQTIAPPEFSERLSQISGWRSFAEGCALTIELDAVAAALEAYDHPIAADLERREALLAACETSFLDVVGALPRPLQDAMLGKVWPWAAPPSATLRDKLRAHRNTCHEIARSYADLWAVLAAQQRHVTYASSLAQYVTALSLDPAGGDATEPRTPEQLAGLARIWRAFDLATEARHQADLMETRQTGVRRALQKITDRLPVGLPPVVGEASRSIAPDHAGEAVALIKEFAARASEIGRDIETVHDRVATAFRQQHRIAPGLAAREAESPLSLRYSTLDRLDQSLRLWLRVIQSWDLQTQLDALNKELADYPSLEEARKRKALLQKERVKVAGDVLHQQWLTAAAELSDSSSRAIDDFINATEALNQPGQVPDYAGLKRKTERAFPHVLKLFPVWLTTNLSTQDLPLEPEIFDLVVIDEASQCDIPSALPLLFRGRRLVIIGDEMQLNHIATLRPIVHAGCAGPHNIAIGSPYDYVQQSLFALGEYSAGIHRPGQAFLDEHYRSVEEVIQFSNQTFYGDRLHVLTSAEAVPKSIRPAAGVFWLDVKGKTERPRPQVIFNQEEVRKTQVLLTRLYEELQALGLDGVSVGLVTPFSDQSRRLRSAVARLNTPELLVGTVHTFQGNERDIMVFSTVATKDMPPGTYHWMSAKPNLLNVAVTRARWAMVVIGDHDYFMSRPPSDHYHKLAEYAGELGHVCHTLDELPLLQLTSLQEPGEESVRSYVVRPDTPFSNRRTLRAVLATCEDFIYWEDPHMSYRVCDVLSMVLDGAAQGVHEVRLLTDIERWHATGRDALSHDSVRALHRELNNQGVQLRLGLLEKRDLPHDRVVIAANQSLNIPPVNTIFQHNARISEFTPSALTPADFGAWWLKAKEIDLSSSSTWRRRAPKEAPEIHPAKIDSKMQGVVVRYFDNRGYGYLSLENRDDDLFFHISDVQSKDAVPITEGVRLEFVIVETPKGSRAVEITVVR